jgi:TPR repeat protein
VQSGDHWLKSRSRKSAVFFAALAIAAVLSVAGTDRPAFADYTDGVIAANKISLETAIRIWRKSAWQDDDFLSEIKLGDIYGDERTDNRYGDPVEAYVWYYLASVSTRIEDHIGDPNARRVISNDFHRALNEQQKLMLLLNADQREQARNRIVYILSCRGADGYIRLGQIHSTLLNQDEGWRQGDSGEPANESPMTYGGLSGVWHSQRDFRERSLHEYDTGDAVNARRMMGISTSSVIVPSDGEALVYFHIADNMGHPLAREYLRSLDAAVRAARWLGPRISQESAEKAKSWFPPYEFYPLGDAASGVPHTDECTTGFERDHALALVDVGVPLRAVQQALWFLGLSSTPSVRWGITAGPAEFRAIVRFQSTRGEPPSGHLERLQAVRLIQTAAIRGDASSQNTLGVMYAHGIGVPLNYVRAAYWFSKSADQRYGAALYHLGVLYKKGPEGIHQDLSKSNDYFTAAALAGFRPSMNQLQDLLDTADNGPHRDGHH